MFLPIVFGLFTATFGAGAVLLFEWWYNNRFRDEAVFLIGEGLFLSMYNAVTIKTVLSSSPSGMTFLIAGGVSLVAAFIYQFCEDRFHDHDGVTPTELYHMFFIVLQSFYTAIAVMVAPITAWYNLILVAYATTLVASVVR